MTATFRCTRTLSFWSGNKDIDDGEPGDGFGGEIVTGNFEVAPEAEDFLRAGLGGGEAEGFGIMIFGILGAAFAPLGAAAGKGHGAIVFV
jgi:hypothetical protein